MMTPTRRQAVWLSICACAALLIGSFAIADDGDCERSKRRGLGTDCVCNDTDKPLTVYITSGHGVRDLHIQPGKCKKFKFVDDQKPRVLSAFWAPNELVAYFEFMPVNNPPFPDGCLHITHGQRTADRQHGGESSSDDGV